MLIKYFHMVTTGRSEKRNSFCASDAWWIQADTSIDTFTAYKMYISSKPWVSKNYRKIPSRKPDWISWNIFFTLKECDNQLLDDEVFVKKLLLWHQVFASLLFSNQLLWFMPQGVTCVAMLAESHIEHSLGQRNLLQFVMYSLVVIIQIHNGWYERCSNLRRLSQPFIRPMDGPPQQLDTVPLALEHVWLLGNQETPMPASLTWPHNSLPICRRTSVLSMQIMFKLSCSEFGVTYPTAVKRLRDFYEAWYLEPDCTGASWATIEAPAASFLLLPLRSRIWFLRKTATIILVTLLTLRRSFNLVFSTRLSSLVCLETVKLSLLSSVAAKWKPFVWISPLKLTKMILLVGFVLLMAKLFIQRTSHWALNAEKCCF